MQNKIQKVFKIIKNPLKIIPWLGGHGLLNWVPDEIYLKLVFKSSLGYWPNLKSPRTFNEKIQWLKLHDRNPLYTQLVDKYEVRKYIAETIGEKYLIPLLGVWDSFDEIDFDKLPNQFVLKCTHDSGGLVICKDKSKFDIEVAKKKITRCLKCNYYCAFREWPYKNVKPRIIAEKYMEDSGKVVPEDYKVYCFNGISRYVVVFHNRFAPGKALSETVYDCDWNAQGISLDSHFQISDCLEPKPGCLEEMLRCAGELAKGKAQSRIDFYIVDGKLYFGEITLYTASGLQKMIPKSLDETLGSLIELGAL
ncbi:TupA-like ATPgrasp [Fibrobacter intestinalis]|uniref:TupA-like ATPgrasp n=1 Tax=Fibrobacter intestinalis TaxID=28122 RepID=A0A1M6VUP0_9BACT|nr:ATP-grasp fold amidoligase family protein [Fibrobacter intestinalis]SHK85119.1 TupA-like ATPgrasp [Fibrobacter intestinalis]